ncbi:Uncharacterised protein [uncultured archaeon]|nr:Uncharacterised protein [uncultured archaeon]
MQRGQISAETAIVAAVMLFLLLMIVIVNDFAFQEWTALRQSLSASATANRMAAAINRVAAGGNGTSYSFFNSAPIEITNMTIYAHRALRVDYEYGGYVAVPLSTNNTNVSGNGTIPLNAVVMVNNTDGTIYVSG